MAKAAGKKRKTKKNAEIENITSAGDRESVNISSTGFVGGLCRMPDSH